MELCERLAELRKNANLSQEKLAEKLNISRQAVSKWESGTTSPDLNNLISLGEIYGVSTDYILLGQSSESVPPACEGQIPEKPADKENRKFHMNGFIWLLLGILSVLVLYYATNLF